MATETSLSELAPLMEMMGKQIYYCGGPGMGLQAKLTQNLILSNILQAFNEGIVLSTKAGVDPESNAGYSGAQRGQVRTDRVQSAVCSSPGLLYQFLREMDA